MPAGVMLEKYFYSEDAEQRYQIIGLTSGLLLLLVVYVDRSHIDNEIIRIISARKENAYEKGVYEDQFG